MFREERITLALILSIIEHRALGEAAERQLMTNERVEVAFLECHGLLLQQKKETVETLKTQDQGVIQLRG